MLVKKILFFSGLLFFAILCSVANAGKESLPGIYILLFENSSSAIISHRLNDTGVTRGGNYSSGNNTGCTGVEIGAQDCSHGRDADQNNNADGHAGFSFTKLASNGSPLADQSAAGTCVKDNVTGLIWEVKTNNGLHNRGDTYSWYNTDPSTNGGANGYARGDDDDTCYGYNSGNSSTFCNTQAYVNRVNTESLCGASDWRIPTYVELQGIVSYGHFGPTIDELYFPYTPAAFFWSSTPSANFENGTMGILFYCGNTYASPRNKSQRIRLVRNGQ